MKKIISLIASYNPNNPYLKPVFDELSKVGDVKIFTTDIPPFDCDYILFDKSIKHHLVYEPRKWIVSNLNKDWEWVLYNEDDILIPEKSIKNVLEYYNKFIEYNYIPGFIRYELLNGEKYWIDMHPAHSIHRRGNGTVRQKFEDIKMFEPWNLHSGNWIFNKREILKMVENNQFETNHNQYGITYCGILESAASIPYYRYTKIFPYEIENVECHHLSDKYVKIERQIKDIKL